MFRLSTSPFRYVEPVVCGDLDRIKQSDRIGCRKKKMNVIFLIWIPLAIILESHICSTENKACTCKPYLTVIKPVPAGTYNGSLPEGYEEGPTFYFDDSGYHFCCDNCKQNHVDYIPTVEFDVMDGLRSLKQMFKCCCCTCRKRRSSTTTENPKPKEPPKSCGKILKDAYNKVIDEMKKPFFVGSVCDCDCHRLVHYYVTDA